MLAPGTFCREEKMKNLVLVLVLVGCGVDPTGVQVDNADGSHLRGRQVPGGDTAVDVEGTGGADALIGVGGTIGTGGETMGGAGGTEQCATDWTTCSSGLCYKGVCMPTCSGGGVKILDVNWCAPMSYPGWECTNGRLNGVNVKCPFDVAVAKDPNWNGPCQDCIGDEIVTNGDATRSASYKSNQVVRYYCDGTGAGPMGNLGTRLCGVKP